MFLKSHLNHKFLAVITSLLIIPTYNSSLILIELSISYETSNYAFLILKPIRSKGFYQNFLAFFPATCEMMEIMQEHGEVVVCTGSNLNIENVDLFLQADCRSDST